MNAPRRQFQAADRTGTGFMSRPHRGASDIHRDDPASAVVNLLDVFLLIGVGFLIVALSGFGLSELLSKGDLTIVKNPGGPNMELIKKKGREITRLRQTGEQAPVAGTEIGKVYQLANGDVIWLPTVPTVPAGSTTTTETGD